MSRVEGAIHGVVAAVTLDMLLPNLESYATRATALFAIGQALGVLVSTEGVDDQAVELVAAGLQDWLVGRFPTS